MPRAGDSLLEEPGPAPRPEGPAAGTRRLNRSLAAGLSVLSIGVAALMLSYAGSLSLALSPWSAIALPAGLALAALMRWGYLVLLGAVVGTFVALLGSGMPAGDASVGALAMGLAALLAHTLMRRLDFDPRLERAVDVGVLALGVLVGAALPATLALAAWFPGDAGLGALQALAAGWVVLGLGMLAAGTAVLSFDRGVLHALQPTGQGEAPGWRGPLLAGLPAAAALLLLWASPGLRSPLGALALLLPLVLVAALAMHGRLAIGSSFLLLASLLVAGSSTRAATIWTDIGHLQAAVAAWVGAALALLLAGHAAHVEWRGRAQRWEWALDGSRLGVADWLLHRPEGFASVAWRTLTGHSDAGWTTTTWLQQVHAEDRPALAEAVAAVVAGRAGRRQLELRQQRDGTWRWLEATLLVVERDAAGRPLRLMATLADVHDKRQAQERQLMSVSLFQHLHEGLLITCLLYTSRRG